MISKELKGIIICGQGKMAQTLADVCRAQEVPIRRFPDEVDITAFPTTDNENTVAVHFGSGRQLVPLHAFCQNYGVPLIQGSTSVELPGNSSTVFVNAPNLCVPVMRFLQLFPSFAKGIRPGMELKILESHQAGKKDTSGTARAIAHELGISVEDITSIRDAGMQTAIGVPQEHLGGHAYHTFQFKGMGATLECKIQIHGRTTYAEGAIAVARALVENLATQKEPGVYLAPLPHGVYHLHSERMLKALTLL